MMRGADDGASHHSLCLSPTPIPRVAPYVP
jgi:hypothetical protein